MYKKSFVSLYFTSRMLSILQLSANKSKVLKSATIPLPEGIFTHGHIVDIDTFGTFLKGIWEKLGIKEKSVGIVVPESSTFTKLVTIPRVAAAELDEAVSWQIQEVFPVDSDKLVIDWKLVEKRGHDYDILIVAVYKEVLQSIVGAAEKAELFPVVVLNPSISLTHLITEEVPTLTIYKDSESVISLTHGKIFYGSSILTNPSDQAIEKTALQMINHYRNVKVSSIVVAGETDESLVGTIQKSVPESSVHLFEKKIHGLTSEQVQEYLIPLSLQFAQIAEPSDMTTVNLLPPHLVKKYQHKRARVQIWSLSVTATLFVWTMLSLSIASFLYLNQQTAILTQSTRQQANVTQERKQVESDIAGVNTVTAEVLTIKEATVLPEAVLNEIFSARPNGISLLRYELNLDSGEIKVRGIATDRQALITFKQNLEKSDNIQTVDIPISSFETETNVEFQATFEYLPITQKILKPVS